MTTSAVSALTGVTLRQLQWWDEQAIVSPAQNEKGNREYGPREVRDVQLLATLRRKGITLERASRIIRRIGTKHGIAVIPEGMPLVMAPDHRSAAVVAESVSGPVVIINVPLFSESEVQ